MIFVDSIVPIEPGDVGRAKALVLERRALSARDAIHVAIMERYQVPRIFSFDRGFDGVSEIRRSERSSRRARGSRQNLHERFDSPTVASRVSAGDCG